MKNELDGIERHVLRLESVFNVLGRVAAAMQERAGGKGEVAEFLGDVAVFCEIGKCETSSLFYLASEIQSEIKKQIQNDLKRQYSEFETKPKERQ